MEEEAVIFEKPDSFSHTPYSMQRAVQQFKKVVIFPWAHLA